MTPVLVHELCAAGARLMHDSDQHELIAFRDGELERFLARRELRTVHRYAALGAEARELGLALTCTQLQFLLREESNAQVYASCRNLEEVDEALRGRRHTDAPGAATAALRDAFRAWPPRAPGSVA